jgi:hypothetical protein
LLLLLRTAGAVEATTCCKFQYGSLLQGAPEGPQNALQHPEITSYLGLAVLWRVGAGLTRTASIALCPGRPVNPDSEHSALPRQNEISFNIVTPITTAAGSDTPRGSSQHARGWEPHTTRDVVARTAAAPPRCKLGKSRTRRGRRHKFGVPAEHISQGHSSRLPIAPRGASTASGASGCRGLQFQKASPLTSALSVTRKPAGDAPSGRQRLQKAAAVGRGWGSGEAKYCSAAQGWHQN